MLCGSRETFPMWKMCLLKNPVVVYRSSLETNVLPVSQKDLWVEDLSTKLLCSRWDNWKSSEADSKIPMQGSEAWILELNELRHASWTHGYKHMRTLLTEREHLISLQIISTSAASEREPSATFTHWSAGLTHSRSAMLTLSHCVCNKNNSWKRAPPAYIGQIWPT